VVRGYTGQVRWGRSKYDTWMDREIIGLLIESWKAEQTNMYIYVILRIMYDRISHLSTHVFTVRYVMSRILDMYGTFGTWERDSIDFACFNVSASPKWSNPCLCLCLCRCALLPPLTKHAFPYRLTHGKEWLPARGNNKESYRAIFHSMMETMTI